MYGWHPQKREILIGTRFADTVQVHQVAMPGGARTQLTFFGDRVTDASYHPHNGDYFLFRKDVGGGEWYQIFRFDVASGDVTMLTDGKSRNSEFVWSNKGDRIAYASTLRNGADLDFYVMDPTDEAIGLKPLTENQGGGWQVHDWSPDDRTLLVVGIHLHQREPSLAGRCCHRRRRRCSRLQGGEKVAYDSHRIQPRRQRHLSHDRQRQRVSSASPTWTSRPESLKYLTNDKWDVEARGAVRRTASYWPTSSMKTG